MSWATSIAQLNESDTVQFQLRATLTGNYQQGNVNILTVRSRLDLTYAPVRNIVFKSQNSSLYQSFSSIRADNDIFSRNYFYYQPQKRLYPFGIFYLSANYRRKINARLFGGAGATFQLLNKPSHILKVSASAVYETSRFKGTVYNLSEYDGSNFIKLWRGTLYMAGWNYLFDKKLRLYYDAYWQPAFNNCRNYRAQADLGIELPVWKGLVITALYSYTHEKVVVAPVKQDDKILTFGIGYTIKYNHRPKL
ncbi:MAG: DUF481 domain-containing protein, partial [Chitinophagaceae bacterium]|nr:DUF481 domain-containing protein [Chitinophagaceae bacterium]